jgi:GT2 family glycosyltransferase
MKLAICLPLVDDMVYRSFFTSFVRMAKPVDYEFILPTIPPAHFSENHAAVRNGMVKEARDKGCTHVLMMDTDQRYPADTIIKLLNHNLPVVCAKVHRRYPPFDPLLYQKTRNKYKFRDTPFEQWKDGQLVEVQATGAACMLISTEVFDAIKPPWFRVLTPTKKRPFTVGEDVYFWTQVREAGYKIFVDTSIEIDHIATLLVNRSFHDLFSLVCRPIGVGKMVVE